MIDETDHLGLLLSSSAFEPGSPTADLANETNGAETSDRIDFYRWRPGYHVMPRRNWVNDPCGPGYSISGRCYHLSFQYNPFGWEWGNMSWGHATSDDLVHWRVSREPSIQPSDGEDPCGVFTGCTWPTNPSGALDGSITSIYTSAQHLPINWELPYRQGSELVRMATSRDDGKTWKRHNSASIIPGPPDGLDVTGWRDPFLGPWKSIDKCLGRNQGDVLYGVIAGGIRDVSPAVFLYSVERRDLSQWKFISAVFAPGLNFKASNRLPDFGTNFEVANFITLKDEEGNSYDILFMGIEGSKGKEKDLAQENKRHRPNQAKRANHLQNWLCGKPKRTGESSSECVEQQSVSMEYQFGGCLDWGCYYAANSFYDPVTESHIVYGWIEEDDLPPDLVHKQKWSGMISLPRTLHMKRIHNVVSASRIDLASLDWLHCTPESQDVYTITTLKSTPAARLTDLRRKRVSAFLSDEISKSEGPGITRILGSVSVETKHLEVDLSISIPSQSEQAGLYIYHSAGRKRTLALFYRPTNVKQIMQGKQSCSSTRKQRLSMFNDTRYMPTTGNMRI